ncbi:MAG: hypothetical protein IPH54_01250 [Rhodoferax sp.]|nr:hypothetical protein [Rhodoferax sp.]
MNIEYFDFDKVHHLGESATRPMEPLATRPGVLLRPRRAPTGELRHAGSSLLRCRAYPDSPPTTHSGLSN